MNKAEKHDQINDLERMQMAEHLGKWYGWGSPIGLSIFFLSMAIIIALFINLFLQFVK